MAIWSILTGGDFPYDELNATGNVVTTIISPQQLRVAKNSLDIQKKFVSLNYENLDINRQMLELSKQNIENQKVLAEILEELKKINQSLMHDA